MVVWENFTLKKFLLPVLPHLLKTYPVSESRSILVFSIVVDISIEHISYFLEVSDLACLAYAWAL